MAKEAKTQKSNRGTLIIIGGHEDHDGDRVILKEVASHIKDGKLVLATVASHEPDGYLEKYRSSFADLGVPDVAELYIDERDQAAMDEKLDGLRQVRAVFFSRGDNLRINTLNGDTNINPQIHQI